jgi:hypothetical protein
MKLLLWIALGVVAACGTDDVAATATVSSSGSGGAGGSGGSGGSPSTSSGSQCPPVSCENAYPNGVALLEAFEDCLYCRACYDACATDPGICPNGGMEEGCSMGGTCAVCASSECAWSYDGSTFTGVCAMEYEACDDSAECRALKECRERCTP